MTSMIETSHQDPFVGSSKHVKKLSGSTISGGSSLNHSGIFSGRKIERSLSFDGTESKLFRERIASDFSLQSISQNESPRLSEKEGSKEGISPLQNVPNHVRALSKEREIQTPVNEEVVFLREKQEEMERRMAKMQAAIEQQKVEKDLQIEKLKKKLLSNEEILQSNERLLKDYNRVIDTYRKKLDC